MIDLQNTKLSFVSTFLRLFVRLKGSQSQLFVSDKTPEQKVLINSLASGATSTRMSKEYTHTHTHSSKAEKRTKSKLS